MRLASVLPASSPIFLNQTSYPKCSTGFLRLRPVDLCSLVLPSIPVLILLMIGAVKRGSQLNSGLSSASLTPVCCSAEIRRALHCRFVSLTAIPPCHWFCDHLLVVHEVQNLTQLYARIKASCRDCVLVSLSHTRIIVLIKNLR